MDANDKTKWVFKLRPGVKFHDGSAFNADAVVWNVRKVLDKEAPHFAADQVGVTASRMPTLRSARKIDDLTVELTTAEPDSFLPINLTNLFMASPAHWAAKLAAVPGTAAGPLAGLSFGAKDLFDVAGYPTGCGNPVKLAESGIRSTHAPAVRMLLDAGATFVGKTHTEELAWSLFGTNAHFGTPLNPAAPDRVPGGSSSGSASAVAARLCDIALGSDTGGSVRAPASFCGIYGLRPSHGAARGRKGGVRSPDRAGPARP